MFGICPLSVVPCRIEPSDRSEMVTQLLFGECFEILETTEKWIRIKNAYDEYESWIGSKQFHPLPAEYYKRLYAAPTLHASDLVQVITQESTQLSFPILLGSTLPFYDGNKVELGKENYLYDGSVSFPPKKVSRASILEYAYLYLHAPYHWGGRSPFGIDCSGFTQMVYMLNGIHLLRDACQQAEMGHTLSFVEEAIPGDLAFFDNDEGKIIHVGIVLPDQQIIHASGRVRVDKLDHHGIYNKETGSYTHHLRILKQIIE